MTKANRTTHSIPSTTEHKVVSAPTTPILGDELNREPSDSQQQPLEDAQHEAIRVLAYHKWKAAGCPEGDGTEFWLDAEKEVQVE